MKKRPELLMEDILNSENIGEIHTYAESALWMLTGKNRIAKKSSEKKRRLICELRDQGYSFSQIASLAKAHENTVSRIIKQDFEKYKQKKVNESSDLEPKFIHKHGKIYAYVEIPREYHNDFFDEIYEKNLEKQKPWDVFVNVFRKRINEMSESKINKEEEKKITNKNKGVDYEYIKSKWVTSED